MRHALALAIAGLLGAAGTALAQEPMGDVARGHELARRICSECHLVERDEARPGRPVSFQQMADDPAATELSLRAFLRTPHRSMPNLILSKEQIGDVLAYIDSLK